MAGHLRPAQAGSYVRTGMGRCSQKQQLKLNIETGLAIRTRIRCKMGDTVNCASLHNGEKPCGSFDLLTPSRRRSNNVQKKCEKLFREIRSYSI
jgi:hypothetical protein